MRTKEVSKMTNDNISHVEVEKMNNTPDLLDTTRTVVDEHTGDHTALWADMCDNSAQTATNVRKAYLFAVCSVQTVTDLLDRKTGEIALNDLSTVKEAVLATTDGRKKWEKVHEFWTSDIPENAIDALETDGWVGFQAELIGLTTDHGGREHAMYIRPTKANLIAEILGDYGAMCLDSARRSVLEPQIKELFDKPLLKELYVGGSHRSKWPPADSKRLMVSSQEFLEERLKTNPEAYRVITRTLLDLIEYETGVDRHEISHALFLAGIDSEPTSHEPLRAWIDTE